jgi:hypothetical protein
MLGDMIVPDYQAQRNILADLVNARTPTVAWVRLPALRLWIDRHGTLSDSGRTVTGEYTMRVNRECR